MSFRFQILILGLIIVMGTGLYWWWLERKITKGQNLHPTDGTPNSIKERIDPLISEIPAGIETTLAKPAADDLPALPAITIDRRPVLNPLIDCIAMLAMDDPCSGEFALNLLPSTRRIGSKTWLVEGFNGNTEAWEPVIAGQTYNDFQAGIQLVNRHGALNDVEFSEFVAKASQLAEGLGAAPDFPEMLSEVARARALEQFTKGHDIRLSLNLHAKRAAWSLPYLQQHAHKAGFVAGVIPGRWVLGDGRHEMLALTIDAHLAMDNDVDVIPIRKLALTLEVPQVARCDLDMNKPFDVMSDIAIRLCAGMEAILLDEGGLAVDVQALQRTAVELEAVYDQLDSFGTPAGSALAKRLFS